ncbi:uncharacterized protein PV09_08056, partial [Verruconis gallopava]
MSFPTHPFYVNRSAQHSPQPNHPRSEQYSTDVLLQFESNAHEHTRQILNAEYKRRITVEAELQQMRTSLEKLNVYNTQLINSNNTLRSHLNKLLCLPQFQGSRSDASSTQGSNFKLDPDAPKLQQIKILRRKLARREGDKHEGKVAELVSGPGEPAQFTPKSSGVKGILKKEAL